MSVRREIRAAVSRQGAPHPAIETVTIDSPGANEVLVRNVAVGICHTDLTFHTMSQNFPIVLGHEAAGVVEQVGSGVTNLRRGDHVVLTPGFCGECPCCTRGAPSYCYDGFRRNLVGLRPDGSSPLSQNGELIYGQFFGQSSFADYSIAAAHCVVKVPAEMPLENLGPLGCGVQTGAGAVINSLALRPGDSIAIFGTGGVGLSAVMAARLIGAAHIIAVDVNDERLKLAGELGATTVVNSKLEDPVAVIRTLTGRGASASLNTTALPQVFTQAMECLANQGVAGFLAPPQGDWSPNMLDMMFCGKRLVGILEGDSVPQHFIPQLLQWYRQGRFPFDRLLKFYPFESIAEAMRDAHMGVTIKPVLRTSAAT